MPIARRDADLARIASSERNDPMLDRLVRLADTAGFGFRVTLLVDGRFIEGNLGMPEQWAELADEAVDAAVDEFARTDAAGLTREEWEEFREDLKEHTFKASVAKQRERDRREREMWEDVGSPEKEELMKRSGEMTREVSDKFSRRRATRPAFTLTNAVIEDSSGQTVDAGMIRVVMAHVAAWWIGGRR
jgi:hypothetical protein